MSRHPIDKGRLLYDMRQEEIVEVNKRYRDFDNNTWRYEVCDGSHTAYEQHSERVIDNQFQVLPITIHDNFKSKYILDYENLIQNLDGSFGFSFSKQNVGEEK